MGDLRQRESIGSSPAGHPLHPGGLAVQAVTLGFILNNRVKCNLLHRGNTSHTWTRRKGSDTPFGHALVQPTNHSPGVVSAPLPPLSFEPHTWKQLRPYRSRTPYRTPARLHGCSRQGECPAARPSSHCPQRHPELRGQPSPPRPRGGDARGLASDRGASAAAQGRDKEVRLLSRVEGAIAGGAGSSARLRWDPDRRRSRYPV